MGSTLKSRIDDYVLLHGGVDWGSVLVVVYLDHVVEDSVHVFLQQVLVVVLNVKG